MKCIFIKEIKNIFSNWLILGSLFIIPAIIIFSMSKAPSVDDSFLPFMVVFTVAYSLSASSFLEEKREDILETMLAGPCNLLSIIIGKTLALTCISLVVFSSVVAVVLFWNALFPAYSQHLLFSWNNCRIWLVPIWTFSWIGTYGLLILTTMNLIRTNVLSFIFNAVTMIFAVKMNLIISLASGLLLCCLVVALGYLMPKEKIITGLVQ